MMFDAYRIAEDRRVELEAMMRRKELLRGAVLASGPSFGSRLASLARRVAGRERVARPTPVAPVYTTSSCVSEPV